ncbi:MAG: aminotransferase class I/II-fold pyridoxal phosphate-dependent enzyme [Actinomycetia bacterium]|nr:aminotransferase class I/II-fold pyridoxal phosphate-dependent enzyme [Actinomycetes bacterium]
MSSSPASNRYDDLSLVGLRARTSAKWRHYPPDVLPMWVAETDFPLAEPIARALRELVDRGDCGYAVGEPLVAAFAGFAARRYGWAVDPALTRACPDVMSGVAYALRALTAPGDAVAFFTPSYPPFFTTVGWIGRRVVELPLAAGNVPDLDALASALRAGLGAILLCNPHNPTGRRFTAAELAGIAELADRHGVPVVSDEIHAPLVLDPAAGPHLPFGALDAECARRGVTLHAASKGWNVPGLKAAVLVAGSAEALHALSSPEFDHLAESAGIAGVAAGVAAFTDCDAWLDDTVAYIAGNHRLVQQELPRVLPGARVATAEATYLAWLDLREVAALRGSAAPADAPRVSEGSDALVESAAPADVVLDKARVALSPGANFGARYRGFARLNLGTSRPVLREALERLAALTR